VSAAPPSPNQPSLLRLAWPLIVSFTARALLTSIDVPYASRLGDAAVAAIGLVFPLEFTFIACWVGTSASLTSHLSRAFGERHEARIAQLLAATRRLVVGLCAAFVTLAAALWAGADRLGLEPEVAASLAVYGPTLLVGAASCGFWSILPDSLVKAHYDTKTTMVAGLLSGGLNFGLNTLFLFVFGWGIFGIGLATGLGRLGGLVFALWRARALERRRRATWAAERAPQGRAPAGQVDLERGANALTDDGHYARPYAALLFLAVPSSLTFALMATEGLVVNYVLAGFADATAAIAGFAIYHRASLLLTMPIAAIGVATLPFVARSSGEGRPGDVARGLRQAHGFGVAYVLLLVAPVCLLFAEDLAGFLGTRPETVALAAFAVRWATPLAVLAAIPFMIARPAFEGLRRGGPPLVMAALRYVVLSLPLALAGATLAADWGYAPFAGLLLGLIGGSGVVSIAFSAWLVRVVRGLRAEAGPKESP